MIQRTYAVQMPSVDRTTSDMDIMPFGPVGTQAVPMDENNALAPAAWEVACTDGKFFEIRGRALPPQALYGTAGFAATLRLGWNLTIQAVTPGSTRFVPIHRFSNTLISGVLGNTVMTTLADPSYGPVIRLFNHADLAGSWFIVHLNIFDQRDESERRA
jgi:hypothetical protein